MRWLAALILALAAVGAQAFEHCVPRSTWTPFGAGTSWVHGATHAEGVRVFTWGWWCPQSDGQWRSYIIRCVEGRTCLSVWAVTTELDTASRSVDPLQSLRSAVDRYSRPPLDVEVRAWEQAWIDATAALQASKPAAPGAAQLVVGPATRADGTRPAYRYVDGARSSTQVTPGATAGQACGTVFETTNAGSWATFGPAFAPDVGALCVKP